MAAKRVMVSQVTVLADCYFQHLTNDNGHLYTTKSCEKIIFKVDLLQGFPMELALHIAFLK
jgi:hypothetical protein